MDPRRRLRGIATANAAANSVPPLTSVHIRGLPGKDSGTISSKKRGRRKWATPDAASNEASPTHFARVRPPGDLTGIDKDLIPDPRSGRYNGRNFMIELMLSLIEERRL